MNLGDQLKQDEAASYARLNWGRGLGDIEASRVEIRRPRPAGIWARKKNAACPVIMPCTRPHSGLIMRSWLGPRLLVRGYPLGWAGQALNARAMRSWNLGSVQMHFIDEHKSESQNTPESQSSEATMNWFTRLTSLRALAFSRIWNAQEARY